MSSEHVSPEESPRFDNLGLPQHLVDVVERLGYEQPSPIQAATIPLVLAGNDVVGQAQTGTGKTAAFALPLLAKIDLSIRKPQALVLAPTRELAIQVAEAIQSYGAQMKSLQVLSIYGGQGYREQLQALKKGVQVIVGTPGRVMDHMRRETLKLDSLNHLVLDEADEMLRMGFIDDVEWILSHIPEQRQISLFSATMPTAIRRIASTHLRRPEQVTIKTKTTTATTIRQRYWLAKGMPKTEALCRILEVEPCDATIVFVRTKQASTELAEQLAARDYKVAALNGDIAQQQRERTVEQLKKGRLDILVATDVVARGLDVDRISHVINFDIPNDTEAYVHRIGRTGRAGRSGEAILFVAPRERRMLQLIEKATRQQIEEMGLPSGQELNTLRKQRFLQRVDATMESGHDLDVFRELLAEHIQKTGSDPVDIAAALAVMVQGDTPLLVKETIKAEQPAARPDDRSTRRMAGPGTGMERFRIAVGRKHKVSVGHIVGAIANEADIDSEHIGRIQLYDDFSTVDLPEGMPEEVLEALQEPRVAGQRLAMSRFSGELPEPARRRPGKKFADDRSAPKAKRKTPKASAKKLPSKRKPREHS